MQLIRGLHNVRRRHRGAAVTIGNFDGVHRGHRAMIERLRRTADERGCPALVVTFEPHPGEYLTPQSAPSRLTGLREKLSRLAATGVDGVLFLRFDDRLASLSAEAFATRLLGEQLAVDSVLVGSDFRFGCRRRGDVELLTRCGAERGYTVEAMPAVEWQGERISSSRIRLAVASADFQQAESMLGEPYRVNGRVVRGDAMGRELGWPTANLKLPAARLPLAGIYAGRVDAEGLSGWPAAISVGVRPTVCGRVAVFEAHLIDYRGDLYGRHLSVEPVCRLRGETHFPSLTALAEQIGRDVEAARRILGDEFHLGEAAT